MKTSRPPLIDRHSPQAQVARYLSRLAAVWILTVIALLIIATFKA